MSMCQLRNTQQLEHSTYFSSASYGFHKDFYHHFKKVRLQYCHWFKYQLNYVNIQQDKRIHI